MGKKDDTFEMLDNTLDTPKKSIILLIIIGLLVTGGISAFALKHLNQPNTLPAVGELVNDEITSPNNAAPTDSSAEINSPPVNPLPSTPIEAVINFGEASAALSPEQLAKIETFYQQIKGTPGTIQINGYTDDVGPDEEGLILSAKRADNVATSLQVLKNDSRFTLTINSYGEENPVGDNTTILGRQENRRVELKFTPQP